MTLLRRAGRSCDTDYAGRSLNGQIKLANRLESRFVVIVKGGEAIVRQRGERDVVVPLDELAERLPA
jgi:histidyl-tRNA synthetase